MMNSEKERSLWRSSDQQQRRKKERSISEAKEKLREIQSDRQAFQRAKRKTEKERLKKEIKILNEKLKV